jgi:plasmid stability protein
MATLHVRGVSDDLHRRLRRQARASSRSISAEVITLLDEAAPSDRRRLGQKRLLDAIRRRRLSRRRRGPGVLVALREGRNR